MMVGQRFRKFSTVEDMRLVANVKKYPALYNHEGLANRSGLMMQECWQAISKELGISAQLCKKRWRDIRDHYFKLKKKEMMANAPVTRWQIFEHLSFLEHSSRGRRGRSRGQHSDPLDQEDEYHDVENLFDVFDSKTTFKVEGPSSQEEVLTSQEELPSSYSHLEYVMVPPHIEADTSYRPSPECTEDGSEHNSQERKRKRTQEDAAGSRVSEDVEDDVDVFMKSIALSVRKLSPKLRAEAKMKILSLVTELEFPSD